MLVVFIIFNIKIIGEANFIVIIISYLESSKVNIISLFNSSRLLNNKYCIANCFKILKLNIFRDVKMVLTIMHGIHLCMSYKSLK